VIWLAVGLGGALGSMARHGLNGLVHRLALAATFPYGILVVNVTGSLLIGVVAGMAAAGRLHFSYEMRTFVVVGLVGGFTTFSSFSLDTLALIKDGHAMQAVWNVAGQLALGLVAVFLGFRLGHGPAS
jgi:CrcB protein